MSSFASLTWSQLEETKVEDPKLNKCMKNKRGIKESAFSFSFICGKTLHPGESDSCERKMQDSGGPALDQA